MTRSSRSSGSPLANRWSWLGALLVCLLLTLPTARWIQGDNIKGDATQNVTLAYALYDRGAFTMDHSPEHIGRDLPTNFREPLPPAVTAVYLHMLDAAGVPFTLSSLHAGEHTRLVKLVNLFWVYLALLGSWALVHRFTGSHRWALAASGLCFVFYFNGGYTVNSMYTELPTAAALLWLSWALLGAQARPSAGRWVLAGLIIGALCLIKALFLYVAPPLAVLIAWGSAVRGRWLPAWRPFLGALVPLLLGTLIVAGPWMVRNQIHFDSPQLTQGRSGWVLYKRALLNEMSADEFRRGFTVWGPQMYRDLVAGTPLAIQESDLKTWNGSLRRLFYGKSEFMENDLLAQGTGDPDRAVSLYRKTSALYVKLEGIFKQAGHPYPEFAGDQVMQKEALRRIAADPWAHLRMSTLMFWRGMWCFSPHIELPPLQKWYHKRTVVEPLNLLCMLALLGLTAAGLLRRRADCMALTLPVMGMLGLYTALSQNLPRFFAPAQPFMLLSLLLLVWLLLNRHKPDASPILRV